jgi:hypothetical protein
MAASKELGNAECARAQPVLISGDAGPSSPVDLIDLSSMHSQGTAADPFAPSARQQQADSAAPPAHPVAAVAPAAASSSSLQQMLAGKQLPGSGSRAHSRRDRSKENAQPALALPAWNAGPAAQGQPRSTSLRTACATSQASSHSLPARLHPRGTGTSSSDTAVKSADAVQLRSGALAARRTGGQAQQQGASSRQQLHQASAPARLRPGRSSSRCTSTLQAATTDEEVGLSPLLAVHKHDSSCMQCCLANQAAGQQHDNLVRGCADWLWGFWLCRPPAATQDTLCSLRCQQPRTAASA